MVRQPSKQPHRSLQSTRRSTRRTQKTNRRTRRKNKQTHQKPRRTPIHQRPRNRIHPLTRPLARRILQSRRQEIPRTTPETITAGRATKPHLPTLTNTTKNKRRTQNHPVAAHKPKTNQASNTVWKSANSHYPYAYHWNPYHPYSSRKQPQTD